MTRKPRVSSAPVRHRSPFFLYGNTSEKDTEIIDAYLARLTKGAVVVNLGCGPNTQHELNNLACPLCQFHSKLILADLNTTGIEEESWVPGPEKVYPVTLNAAMATTVLGKERADLILALGLFGDLHSTTTQEGTGKSAWPAVLRECLCLLKPLGALIVSNSCDRQPFEEFKAAAQQAGFMVTYHHVSPALLGSVKPGEQRYLIVLQRPRSFSS